MYKQSLMRRTKVPSPYHRIDPGVLFYLNSSGCRCRAVMAAFMDAAAFSTSGTRPQDCCDNAIYSTSSGSSVPEWSRHGVHASDSIQYLSTDQFLNCQVEVQLNRAAAVAGRQTRTTGKSNPTILSNAVREALNEWISRQFPKTHWMILPLTVRDKIASCAESYSTESDLIITLSPRINLGNSPLVRHRTEMLALILGAVQSHRASNADTAVQSHATEDSGRAGGEDTVDAEAFLGTATRSLVHPVPQRTLNLGQELMQHFSTMPVDQVEDTVMHFLRRPTNPAPRQCIASVIWPPLPLPPDPPRPSQKAFRWIDCAPQAGPMKRRLCKPWGNEQ